MTTIGLRELRQHASELVRRAEAGEEVTITVAGRPSARLVPVSPRAWRQWDEIAELFRGPADTTWAEERDRLDGELTDPWLRR
ncbi:type II toxin-antitoxin system Phd/YefM family antitoxin [Geodermatophilus marinus]|uniref:type II toxin-antitoxin system Phd/YefM family antitoxin n=1 Tax=Geodermatophilus sp. LHW52908 TaxID=2303986 RepID=UPI000E3D3522|nr:type II toxin-antitoxin system prevent-host-death family antitoxin [Geodermatophilus sp. LHW52908]RFU21298.1 type II toxin-antitoxin system Phd/YefM family antitoxin [Geodermatophilus sp. LHW52908]